MADADSFHTSTYGVITPTSSYCVHTQKTCSPQPIQCTKAPSCQLCLLLKGHSVTPLQFMLLHVRLWQPLNRVWFSAAQGTPTPLNSRRAAATDASDTRARPMAAHRRVHAMGPNLIVNMLQQSLAAGVLDACSMRALCRSD